MCKQRCLKRNVMPADGPSEQRLMAFQEKHIYE